VETGQASYRQREARQRRRLEIETPSVAIDDGANAE
jgi:hypothetical protein